MVASIRGYTPNYSFKLINFDTPRWHTLEYDNWNVLDALLKQAYIPTIRGVWTNFTAYLAGDRVIDPDSGAIYRCEVGHSSAASPTTFAEDRLAHPTFWMEQIAGVPVFRGTWAPSTVYAQGDIVEFASYEYYLCNVAHTSGATFALNADKWTKVFDATNVVLAAQAAADAAAASAAEAAASESNAATSAADAAASEAAAQAAAQAAEDAQGAFRWNFDDGVAAADPGTSNMRFNNATVASATALILSAQTADITNPDISAWIVTWDDSTNTPTKGTIYVRKVNMPQVFVVFELTGIVVDNGTWLEVGVTPIQNAGLFFDGEPVSVAFIRTGNQGLSGAGTGDMLAANNLNDVANIPSSRTNLGLGDTSTPTFAQVSVGTPTVPANAATKQYVDDTAATANAAIALKVAKAGDTMSGALVLSGAPTLTLHAATKQYTDDGDAVNAAAIVAGDALKVSKAGDTMTGHLTLPINPLDANAVRKDYVDSADAAVASAIGNKVSKSGDMMSGALELFGAPTIDLHAATKLYVDNAVAGVDLSSKVSKTGDTMSGPLNATGISLDPPYPNSVLAAYASFLQVGLNQYLDVSGGFWRALSPGYSASIVMQSGTSLLEFYSTTASSSQNAPISGSQRQGYFSTDGGFHTRGALYPSSDASADLYALWQSGGTYNIRFNAGYSIWSSTAQMQFTFQGGYWMMLHGGGSGSFQVNVAAYKPGGGTWTDNSDARIKNIQGNFTRGLDVIAALQPVNFTFKGNDTVGVIGSLRQGVPPGEEPLPESQETSIVPYPESPHYHVAVSGKQFTGLIAQDVEVMFPEIVTQRTGYIDGVYVTDLRDIDTTPLIFALVNAIKELKARIEVLEGP